MDPITFDPLGTITVIFDDVEYRLTRPKMGQWRYFQRAWSEGIREAQSQLSELNAKYALAQERLDLAKTETAKKKAVKEAEALGEELREYTVKPLYEWQIPWTREVFAQLGDQPLPEDSDEWPAWLATDPSLPNQIIAHWQAHPKASGGPSN